MDQMDATDSTDDPDMSDDPEECEPGSCDGFQFCNTQTGECVDGCSEDGQCGSNETCQETSHECICDESASEFGGNCYDPSSGECGDAECGEGEQCDFETGTCTCSGDADVRFAGACLPRMIQPRNVHNPEFEFNDAGIPHIVSLAEVNEDTALLRDIFITQQGWAVSEISEVPEPIDPGFYPTDPPMDISNQTIGVGVTVSDYVGYASGKPSTWEANFVYENVAPNGFDIAMSDANVPHMSFQDLAGNILTYFTRDGEDWRLEQIEPLDHTRSSTSIALDGTGTPHIAYSPGATAELNYAVRAEDGWQTEQIASDATAGRSNVDIVIDDSGAPHIVAPSDSDSTITYARLENDGWTTQVIDSRSGINRYADIEIDGEGQPHVSYVRYDGSEETLVRTHRDGSDWVNSVHFRGSMQAETDLEIHQSGFGYIVYMTGPEGPLNWTSFPATN